MSAKETAQGILGLFIIVGIAWIYFSWGGDDDEKEVNKPTAKVEQKVEAQPSAPKLSEQSIQLSINTMKEYGVLDAAVTQEDYDLQLVLIVSDSATEADARELGDNFLRQVATNSGLEGSMGKEIGPTRFAYTIGIYRKDETQVLMGAKAPASRNIRW